MVRENPAGRNELLPEGPVGGLPIAGYDNRRDFTKNEGMPQD
jgi:hypothetical protein